MPASDIFSDQAALLQKLLSGQGIETATNLNTMKFILFPTH